MASSADSGNKARIVVESACKDEPLQLLEQDSKRGVRLIHERETKLGALDASIMRGIASADAGRIHGLDDVAAKLDAKYANMAVDRQPL